METVAIIGASNDRSKYGNKAVRAFLQKGFRVFPVNPREREVEGLPAFAAVGDIPGALDRVSSYVPPPVLLGLLPGIAAKGCGELWLNPGAESEAVLVEASRLGLKVVQACSILAIGVSPEAL